MAEDELWPFFFEVNLIEPKTFRERTAFVDIHEDGSMSWIDHTGRFGRRQGFGGFASGPNGELRHFRGDRELSESEEEAERKEFSITANLDDAEFAPLRALITSVGRPWTAGWEAAECERLHDLLEDVYWKHVNRFMLDPFLADEV
jgi:hypothetical protein